MCPIGNLSFDGNDTVSTDPAIPVESSHLIGLFIPGHHAHSLDEGVPRVVHPGLDALIQGVPVGGHLVPEAGVDARRQALGHAVVVLAQVRVVSAAGRGTRGITVSPGQSSPRVCEAKNVIILGLCAVLDFRREGKFWCCTHPMLHCVLCCLGPSGKWGSKRSERALSLTETS